MHPSRPVLALSAFLCLVLFCPLSRAQQTQARCTPPQELVSSNAPNIFSPQQEIDLGDVEAEQIERRSRVIYDDDLAANLNQIVARILAQLPPTQLHFRVVLIDLPTINAFSLPGGRIYVTRKMVAFARNENELAALLSHEMGHILSHQGGIDMTRKLRDVLNVTSVGDRKDIEEKINLLMDNAARNPKAFAHADEEEPHQYQADRVGLYALANAGYSPNAVADLFDRTAQTKGKTGGPLSDIFGLTTPNEKRLREMRKSIEAMPASCREQPAVGASEAFLKWQADVVAYSGFGRKDVLSGLLEKKALDPPLRNDITNFKFSPDGKYILAQDDSSIFVLSHDPLRLLFRVDAVEARPAQFTPDSQELVFDTRGLRVEEWQIQDQERTAVHELTIPGGCVQSLLSPDGKTLACVNGEFDLTLYNVADGTPVFTKKKLFAPDYQDILAYYFQLIFSAEMGEEFRWVHLGFSPDSTTFVAANMSGEVAVRVVDRIQISMRGSLPEMVRGGFAFLAPDRVIAVNRPDLKNSAIMNFPSGEVVKRLQLGGDTLSGVAHGDYAIVGPLKDMPVGILDLPSNRFVFGSPENYAVDTYDDTAVAESPDGDIALYSLRTRSLEAKAPISLSPLGSLRATAVSGDLKWLALSGNVRGAVWDVPAAKRVYFTRGFRGAYFDGDQAVYADYPKVNSVVRSIGRMDLSVARIDKVFSPDENSTARQWGPFLVSRQPAKKNGTLSHDIILDVRDLHGGPLWTRAFPKEAPSITWCTDAGVVILGWALETDAGKDELKTHPALHERVEAVRDRKNVWLIEDLDAHTGKEIGALAVDTGKGSFHIEGTRANGDWVTVVDNNGRTLVYVLSTGEQKGALFGTRSALSPAASVLSVENNPGELDIYDLPSLEKRGDLTFSSPISAWWFSEDGKRMLVLTKEQSVYTFDTSRMGSTAPIAAAVK